MLVSVIIPVYNGEKYLKESIDSILNQTYEKIEVLIIDDGSIDSTKKIIEEYQQKDERIKFVSRENKGLVATLNELIEMASGKYIFRMDADDIAHIDRIKKQLVFLEKGYDLVATRINLLSDEVSANQTKMIMERGKNYPMNGTLRDHIFKDGGFLCHPTIAFSKELIDKVGGYSEKCYVAEDLELYLRISKTNARVIKVEDKLLTYRINNFSKSEVELNQDKNIQKITRLRLNYILEEYNLQYKKVIIWGKGHGGYLLKNILEDNFKCEVVMIDKNTSMYDKEMILFRSNSECILIASQIGKFEIIQEIRSNYQEWINKYFCIF